MKTTILILVLNYENALENVIQNVRKLADEILVVCDITKPEKAAVIKEWLGTLQKKHALNVLFRENERGYGSAMRFGFQNAKGDIIIAMTADSSDEPRTVPKMIAEIRNGADVVCGTRFSKGGGIVGNILKERFAKSISLLMRILSRTGTFDATNGFRAYRKSVAQAVRTHENSFAFNIEFLVKAAVQGCRISEVPAIWYNRTSGRPNFNVRREGKTYARWMLYSIFRNPSGNSLLLVLAIIAVLAVFRVT